MSVGEFCNREVVVNDAGGLEGILTLDNAIKVLANALPTLAKILPHGCEQEKTRRNKRGASPRTKAGNGMRRCRPTPTRRSNMAESVYKIIELVGTSEKSWEDAARVAVETASKTLKDLRVAEVTKLDLKVENGRVTAYRARMNISFKYHG